ncbi:MAG: diaminopimelate epimerase [bacterium]
MNVHFFKYQGTGNDFIIVDCRELNPSIFSAKVIKSLCDRRFGIGADGLMLFLYHNDMDFEMKYFNSDGNEGTMCGNGGRCIVAFAKKLGIIEHTATFLAIDGIHEATIDMDNIVRLKMQDVIEVERNRPNYFLNTGSPHYVNFMEDIDHLDVYSEGKKIRNNVRFKKEGTNVNFAHVNNNEIYVRTYERGVEDETLSCGTGVVATAISAGFYRESDISSYKINTLGGRLKVSFKKVNENRFENIWLEGPAEFVFKGEIEI